MKNSWRGTVPSLTWRSVRSSRRRQAFARRGTATTTHGPDHRVSERLPHRGASWHDTRRSRPWSKRSRTSQGSERQSPRRTAHRRSMRGLRSAAVPLTRFRRGRVTASPRIPAAARCAQYRVCCGDAGCRERVPGGTGRAASPAMFRSSSGPGGGMGCGIGGLHRARPLAPDCRSTPWKEPGFRRAGSVDIAFATIAWFLIVAARCAGLRRPRHAVSNPEDHQDDERCLNSSRYPSPPT